ncbi:E3 ubiquitin- ligase DZIP3 [Paramuricea clavata]|uniref:E3 ubiquitin- ligase DZIP3 n=1 Tax=Paramuricea clavata TaxID=317549 RepID=A0A7D9KWS8_PARCT|nr:E3 ubiquitin- ligase DZIP3 [Paramuricea clavata]
MGVAPESYGSLLSSMLMSKLPTNLQLVVSRVVKENEWNLDKLLNTLQQELEARERIKVPATNKDFKKYHGSASALMAGNNPSCTYCRGSHPSKDCTTVTSPAARQDILRKTGRCFVCLRKDHISPSCKSTTRCYSCKGRHHVSICKGKKPPPPPPRDPPEEHGQSGSNKSKEGPSLGTHPDATVCHTTSSNCVLLQTARANIYNPDNPDGPKVKARLILDGGSQCSYVSSALTGTLGLQSKSQRSVNIKTFGSSETNAQVIDVVNLGIETAYGANIEMLAFTVPLICQPLKNQFVSNASKTYPHLANLHLADYSSGQHDAKCVYEEFLESIKYENNHYVVNLPWKPDHAELPDDYDLSKKRLLGLLKRLRENVDNAFKLYEDSRSRLAKANFNLRKITTNSKELQERICQTNQLVTVNNASDGSNMARADSNKSQQLVQEEQSSYTGSTLGPPLPASDDKQKILGILWDSYEDNLIIDIKDVADLAQMVQATKRNVISVSSKIYDRMGFISPLTINFKLLFQELCLAKGDWDHPLEGTLKCNWQKLVDNLKDVQPVVIPRCYISDIHEQVDYSSLGRLLRVTAVVLKFIKLLKSRVKQEDPPTNSEVTSTDIELARVLWIKELQEEMKLNENSGTETSVCLLMKLEPSDKQDGRAYKALNSPPLPEFRVKEAPPFTYVGLDYVGPLYVKSTNDLDEKAWICLITCCVSRAVHLEVVPNMTSQAFLRSFRRFTLRRSTPLLVVSDNAKTFKAASKELMTLMRDPQVKKYFLQQRMRWSSNLEKAPWCGGFFERKKTIGKARLSYDELVTAVTEAESILNSRPKSYVSSEDVEEPLTPAHPLSGRRILSLPDRHQENPEDEDFLVDLSTNDLNK